MIGIIAFGKANKKIYSRIVLIIFVFQIECYRVGADNSSNCVWEKTQETHTHTRFLRNAETFCTCTCFSFVFRFWMWQDIFVWHRLFRTSLNAQFLSAVFQMLELTCTIIRIKNSPDFLLIPHLSEFLFNKIWAHTHIFEFSNWIYSILNRNSYENWWSNSIHVLLIHVLATRFIALLQCIWYALQLLARLLLSFHFDDCILIPIPFMQSISNILQQ